MSSSSASDPRQPSSAKPYVPPTVAPQDLPVDYSGFIAIVFGVTGVMFRRMRVVPQFGDRNVELMDVARNIFLYKLSSWLAIIFCAQSLANMKNVETDLKQISMAMMFAIMGLVTNYFGPSRPGTAQS